MPKLWVHDKLRAGKAIVVIDGVDEVSQSKRQAVRDWLGELVTSFPESRYIVTSRPHAVQEGWIEGEQFEEAELQPMDLTEIHAFIEHWHDAVREGLDDHELIEELPELVENLKAVIKDPRTPIRKLATSPLLCAMICAMHRDRRKRLPQDRIELYDAACYMLLERRDIERGLSLEDYPALKYRQKRPLLEDLAYWMIKNELSEVDVGEATDRFSRRLPNMADIEPGVTADDVLRLFVERSGIIRELVKGRIDFTHRTFQEYLAAKNALDEEDIGLLVKNAHNDQWRQVIILAVGLASAKQRDKLIMQLLERGDKEKARRHQLFLLAVACLEIAVELDQQVKNEVVKRMKQIVPPKSITEAKQLAGAGDLAVPLLTYSDQKARTAAACVRTLAIISSENAIETLKTYAKDKRQAVIRELSYAVSFVDASTGYFESVLSLLTRISLFGIRTIPEPICQLTNLQNLSIDSSRLTSLPESIGQLANLKNLHISTPSLTSLPESIGHLTNLETLTLYFCYSLKSLPDGIGQLANLRTLTIRHCIYLASVPESIGQLSNLHSLSLIGSMGMASLSESIGQLRNLKQLVLYCSNLTSLPESIGQLTNLQILHLSSDILTSLPESIGQLMNLRTLILYTKNLTSLPDSIGQLHNLKSVTARGCEQLFASLKKLLPDCEINTLR